MLIQIPMTIPGAPTLSCIEKQGGESIKSLIEIVCLPLHTSHSESTSISSKHKGMAFEWKTLARPPAISLPDLPCGRQTRWHQLLSGVLPTPAKVASRQQQHPPCPRRFSGLTRAPLLPAFLEIARPLRVAARFHGVRVLPCAFVVRR